MTDAQTAEVALETVAECRIWASSYRQMGFKEYARYLSHNADAAERWLAKAALLKPRSGLHPVYDHAQPVGEVSAVDPARSL